MKISRLFNTFVFFFKRKKIVAQYKIFNDDDWLETSIHSIQDKVYKILIVKSNQGWGATDIDNTEREMNITFIRNMYPDKIIVLDGSWSDQLNQVSAGLEFIKKNIPEASHCLYIDSDEIYQEQQIKKLICLAKSWKTFNREIRVKMDVFFNSPFYRIDPPEKFRPMALFPLRKFISYRTFRNVNLGFIESDVTMLHYSYVRKNKNSILNKMISHKNDEGTSVEWYEKVYLNWTTDSLNFHPVNPTAFKSVKIISEEEIPVGVLTLINKWKNE